MDKFKLLHKKLGRRRELIALLVLVLVVLGFALKNPIKNQLNDWKLLPRPEKLTELYFTQPNSLPKTYTPGTEQTVSFTVHNLEYQRYKYIYQIVEHSQDGHRSQILQKGSFSIDANQFSKQMLKISPLDLGQRVNLSVELVNVSESIDYWVDRG